MNAKISASILSCDFLNLENELKKLERKGIDSFHLDIMDGHFVPNISFGPHISDCVRKYTSLPIETHLMVTNPLNFIDKFSYSKTIYFHVESDNSIIEVIDKLRKMNINVGITINPKTNCEKLIPYLGKVDKILIMTVEPGFGGQKFMYDQIDKIKSLKKIIDENNYNVEIAADGGINAEIANLISGDGVQIVIMGSYLTNCISQFSRLT